MTANILYLHGFCSSPESWKAKLFAKTLGERSLAQNFFCPHLSFIPDQAISQAEKIISDAKGALTLTGSSLGGFYATWLAEKYGLNAVLINPAVISKLSHEKFIGTQTNLYTRETFEFTVEHAEQLLKYQVPEVTPLRYLLMVETGDEVLDYQQAVRHYAGCKQIIIEGGNHSFTHFPHCLAQILEFAGL